MAPAEIPETSLRPFPRQPGPASSERLSDAEIARQVQAGHTEAWDLFVDRYQRLVYSVALGDGLSAEDAIDVTQSTFMIFLESGMTLRHDESLAPWLMTVARRQAWRLRQHHRRETLRAEVPPADEQPPAVDWEQVVALHDALQALDQPCRDLLVALFFEPGSPTYTQVARRMGRSVGTIGPMRGRCLARLRDLLPDVW